MSAPTMSYRSVGKNCNGQFTTERIGRLHDADQNPRNDHERPDADQNVAAETRAIGDNATAVLRIFSGGIRPHRPAGALRMIIAHWLGRLECDWADSVVHAREKSKTYGIDRTRAIEPLSGDKDAAT